MTWLPLPTRSEDPWGDDRDAFDNQLKSRIEALESNPPGGASTHPVSRAYGLGTGSPDGDALQSFFSTLGADFTESGLDRAGKGAAGELSGGDWDASPAGHTIVAPSSGQAGNINLKGQTGGATQIHLADRGTSRGVRLGAAGSSQNLTSATRLGNTFTLGFAGPWFPCDPTTGKVLAGSDAAPAPSASAPLCQVFDVVWVKILNEGVLEWAAYTVTANNVGGDYTKIQYVAFGFDVSGQPQATDACIPPVTGSPLAYFWGSSGYLGGVALALYNFRNPHEAHISDLTIVSDSNTKTPLDGCLLRRSSGCYLEHTVVLDGGFVGEMLNGSAMGPLNGSGTSLYGAQNTDHSESHAVYANCTFNVGLITNDQSNGSFTDPVGGGKRSQIGGGRDNHWQHADMGVCGIAHFFIADDGSLQTTDLDGLNTKSGQDVFYGSGINGVPCNSTLMIDRMHGKAKHESPANFVFNDRSCTRTIWAQDEYLLELEAALSINGAGNNINFAYQPYHLTNVTIVGSPGSGGSMAVMTATITETGHGLVVGTPIQTGNGGPATTISSSQAAFNFGNSLPATIKCTDLSAFPASGSVLIGSSTGTQLVTYTGKTGNNLTGCSGGKENALATPGVGVTSQVLAHETAVKTVDSTGQIITCDLVDYTGPDLTTPSSCTTGRMGFMRCGTWMRVENTAIDWDLGGYDRYVTAGMVFNLQSLGSVKIAMPQDSQAAATRKKFPILRIRDFEGLAGSNGAYAASATLYGNTFTKVFSTPNETQWNASDVGKSIFTSAGNDTIAAVIDSQHVQLTTGITVGTGITWAIPPKSVDDPSFELQRGKRKYRLCYWASSETVDVALGMGIELDASDGRMGGTPSRCSKNRRFIGFAVQACPAPATFAGKQITRVSVTNNGLTGATGRVFINTGSFLVLEAPGAFVASDDVKPLVTTGSVTQNDMVVDDGAAHPGGVKTAALTGGVVSAGQRSLGQALKNGSSGTVALALEPAQWTP